MPNDSATRMISKGLNHENRSETTERSGRAFLRGEDTATVVEVPETSLPTEPSLVSLLLDLDIIPFGNEAGQPLALLQRSRALSQVE
jgi:hypothetical protein